MVADHEAAETFLFLQATQAFYIWLDVLCSSKAGGEGHAAVKEVQVKERVAVPAVSVPHDVFCFDLAASSYSDGGHTTSA